MSSHALATAVVVARGGSTRLPNKALLPFANTTLLGHRVRTLLACRRVGRVVVGSDAPAILDEARRHGAEAVRRDDYHCDEARCSANEMIADMVARVPSLRDGDVVLWAHPTNPLVSAATYGRALDEYARLSAAGVADSLASVYAVRRHAWCEHVPVNFHPRLPRHQPAGELEPVKFQDGAIFVQTAGRFKATRYFYGESPVLFEIPPEEVCDVDVAADLDYARHRWFKREGRGRRRLPTPPPPVPVDVVRPLA